MDNDNAVNAPLVQVTESDIVMTDKGADFKAVDTVVKADLQSVKPTLQDGQDRRATPKPDDVGNDSQYELKSLADKAAICIMRQINKLLDAGEFTKADALMPTAMKLLDAQMAMEWSIKWQKSILERPQHLTGLKAGSSLTELNKGRAIKARKHDKGDQRTTPKRLLKDLPSDDAA